LRAGKKQSGKPRKEFYFHWKQISKMRIFLNSGLSSEDIQLLSWLLLVETNGYQLPTIIQI